MWNGKGPKMDWKGLGGLEWSVGIGRSKGRGGPERQVGPKTWNTDMDKCLYRHLLIMEWKRPEGGLEGAWWLGMVGWNGKVEGNRRL